MEIARFAATGLQWVCMIVLAESMFGQKFLVLLQLVLLLVR